MKKLNLLVWALASMGALFLVNSCNKNTGKPTNTGSGNIGVTSVLPQKGYLGDTFTIAGTGFSTDTTKISVYVSDPAGSEKIARCSFVSASATELKVVPPIFSNYYFRDRVNYGFLVESGNTSKIGAVQFNALPSVSNFQFNSPNKGHNWPNCAQTGGKNPFFFEGDSIFFYVSGDANYNNILLNGHTLNGKATSYRNENAAQIPTKIFSALVPFSFFNEPEPAYNERCNGNSIAKIKVTTLDGKKSTTFQTPYYPSPNTALTSVTLNATSFKKSDINLVPLLTISGYALRHEIQIRVASSRNGTTIYNQVIGAVPSGYPSQYIQQIDLLAMPDPPSGVGDDYAITLFIHDLNGDGKDAIIGGVSGIKVFP